MPPDRPGPGTRRRELPRATATLVLVALLLTAPLYLESAQLGVLVTTAALAIAALGLDVLVGGAGQLSLAHAAFFGVGAFTTIHAGARGVPVALAVLLGLTATALTTTLVGLPALRIRGVQVAVATLAFQAFAVAFVQQFPSVKTGSLLLERPGPLVGDAAFYFFSLACVGVVLLLLRQLRRTRLGRSLVVVRDVEGRAPAFGIAPGPAKLLAYALSGAVTGFGGALFALQQGSINDVARFDLLPSLQLVAVVVVGGAGSAPGILAAAFAVLALPQLGVLPEGLADVLPVAFAALLVVSVVAQPEGVAGVLRSLDARLGDLLAGPRDRPVPRPLPTDAATAAARAVSLRDVPVPLSRRLPVPALLVARDVSVRYGGVQALDAVSLEVRRGEVVGLIGANGAGKSTFFSAVSGLAPVTGSLRYRGRELVGSPPTSRIARGIARTFQDMGLVRAETVRENVLVAQTWLARYPAAAGVLGLGSTLRTERALRVRAEAALELFGLRHLADERLGDLPYGTMRTVEIAAAVSAGPDLLLLDEASAGLTPEEAHLLGERFLALRDELALTLVVIEHHVPLIARTCDYAYCLESGRLIAEGSPDEVVAQPQVVESFLGRGALPAVAAVSP